MTRAAPAPGQGHRDESQRQQRRQLHLRRQRDQHGAQQQHRPTAPRPPSRRGSVASARAAAPAAGVESMPRSANSVPASIRPSISASLWMPATRCMSSSGLAAPSHSALTSATPQRRASRGVAQTIRPDADQHHEPVAQYRGDDVLAGQRGDAAADPQEQRAVGGRRLAPQARYRQREHVVEAQAGRRTDPVGVESEPGDLALRQVGVDVLAVHRRRDQQRQRSTAAGCGRAGCATCRRSPSAKRPSISQASAIITAPVVVIVSDTVWMRDGRLSSRTPKVGSCTTGRAPAPSAPMAIRTVPVAPNSRVRRSATSSASLSGEPTVRSSPCQRAIDELSELRRAATRAA